MFCKAKSLTKSTMEIVTPSCKFAWVLHVIFRYGEREGRKSNIILINIKAITWKMKALSGKGKRKGCCLIISGIFDLQHPSLETGSVFLCLLSRQWSKFIYKRGCLLKIRGEGPELSSKIKLGTCSAVNAAINVLIVLNLIHFFILRPTPMKILFKKKVFVEFFSW